MAKLLPAAALAAQLEPYKSLLGVLVRKDCISLAVSNAYLNLAEPLGALMLREGRLSTRSLQRMLADQQLSGFIIGCEVADDPEQQQRREQEQQVTALQQQAVQQVQGVLVQLAPGLQGGWYGAWSAAAGASCRIAPSAGLAAAAVDSAAAVSGPSKVQQQQQQQQQQQSSPGSLRAAAGVSNGPGGSSQAGPPRCSLGQQFLQDYLDSLGALNTFG
ncbi:hypothetical protein COO60DRAFT_370645 [Scenedesmus sp. NREL 46B-D3]|nr:hypothetical protein COO60DRAFT_370645 [Scenedesmus sp. NREL 46B-D3]